ncbi:MAG: LCP family protein [Christensenellales bacterium]|jgi:LCP family protein required for cell wall assembly
MSRDGKGVGSVNGSNRSIRARGKRSLFSRFYPPRWIVFGVIVGVILSLIAGIVIIYNDMMSGVTFSDENYNEAILAKDLTDDEWLGGLGEDEKKQLEDDFDSFQKWLDEDNHDDPSLTGVFGGESPSTSGDKPLESQQSPESDGFNDGADSQEPPKTVSMQGIENFVLFGVDSRSNNFRGRSDVIMIISLNHNNRTLNLVSLMRGMYVNIGTSKHPWGLLNAAYSYGGPSLAVRTIERNFGIPIKGYVAINFNSFVNIINAVGGVRISLTPREAAYLGLQAGSQKLNGAQALRYARLRRIDSDFHRNKRQRNVVNSVLSSMGTSGVNIYNVINVALANSRTDLNLRHYMSPSYLSYTRRQLQLPALSDTHRSYIRGSEIWPINMKNTHSKLVRFLRGE